MTAAPVVSTNANLDDYKYGILLCMFKLDLGAKRINRV